MFLAIDIGNSLIKFGTFEGPALLDRFTISTKRDYTVDELAFDRFHVLDDRFIQLKFDSVFVASVVPKLDAVVSKMCQKLFKLKPVFVNAGMDLGMELDYEPVSSLGIDRLVGIFSAAETYGTPVIVCSFGTATTIDVVSNDRKFLGGVILPGLGTMAASLKRKTAKLPAVRIERPEALLGNSTKSAIASGVYYGGLSAAEGIVSRIRAEQFSDTKNVPVIATGGFATLLAQKTSLFDKIDENLILNGLRLIAERTEIKRKS